jgi:hypothetical protein
MEVLDVSNINHQQLAQQIQQRLSGLGITSKVIIEKDQGFIIIPIDSLVLMLTRRINQSVPYGRKRVYFDTTTYRIVVEVRKD